MNEAGMDRTTPEKCPKCGASLPAGALAGLCPACLLQQGAAADTATRPNAKPFVPPTIEEIARLFPQLEILGFLGKGGMGAVYKARQPALDRLVALKILPAQAAAPDPGFAERFTREARALARLSHPNIVAVHEFGQASSAGVPLAAPSVPGLHDSGKGETPLPPAGGTPALPYFIMEFVDGVNLRQLQKTGRISPREAMQIIPQICDALQYAHDEGVVHRDIKPENVLVDRKGRVKIADFGLAKILGLDPDALRLTGEGQVMGTPHYMAPEQLEHPLTVDHRADIFSLGVVFYEMLTGELPLGKFQPPSRKVQVDVRLDDVVLHALEKEPGRRYQHVSEVKTDVQTIASGTLPPRQTLGQPVEARPLKKINCAPALSLWCLTTALVVATNWRAFTGHTDYALASYAILAWIVSCVPWSMMHYSCWKALPGKYRATTPGRALGFLFIPLFNFYWPFVSFPSLATGFNALKRERPDLAIRNRTGVGIAYATMTVLSFPLALNHPGWACLISVTDLVLTFVFYLGIVANANLVIEASQAARAPTVATPRGPTMSGPQRLSRTALAGVIWALFAFLASLVFLTVRVVPAGPYSPPVPLVWANPLLLSLLPLGLTAPFDTTLLGWLAIAQIHRSAGRLYGLGLAFVDGMLFPLLALAGLLAWFWWWFYSDPLMHMIAAGPPGTVHVISSFHRFVLNNIGALTVLVAVASSVAAGFFLIRWAWRKANTPLNGWAEPSVAPEGPSPARQSPAGVGAWKIAAAVIVAVVALNCVIVVLAFRPALLKPTADSKSSVTPQPANAVGPFLASLPQGTIELVAVSRFPSTYERCWKPDGSDSDDGPFEVKGASVNADGGIVREFVIRLAGLPEGASEPIWRFDPAAGARAIGGPPVFAGQPVEDMRSVAVQFPNMARATTLKLGLGWGPWETMASSGDPRSLGTRICSLPAKRELLDPQSPASPGSTAEYGSDWFVSFSQAAEKDGFATVNVAHPLSGWDTRVVAVDQDDQERVSTHQASSIGPGKQQTVTFSHLPLAQVKEFRFQVRPYRWVEFRHVSLEPGQQTHVETVNAGNK